MWERLSGHRVSVKELVDTEAVQAVSSRGVPAHPDLAGLNAMEKNRKYPKLEEYRAVSPAHKTSLNQPRTPEFYPHIIPKQNSLSNILAVRKMHHGHQSPWYRKSVRANVKPEEDS